MTFVGNKREKSGGSAALWYIAVYVRLSKEDGDKVESDSIQNQKGIIEQHIRYLQGQGEQVASVEVYSDATVIIGLNQQSLGVQGVAPV